MPRQQSYKVEGTGKTWQQVIGEDCAELRKAGLDHRGWPRSLDTPSRRARKSGAPAASTLPPKRRMSLRLSVTVGDHAIAACLEGLRFGFRLDGDPLRCAPPPVARVAGAPSLSCSTPHQELAP